MWPDQRIRELFRINLPLIQAPMAGPTTVDLAVAVCEAGGLGSLPFFACAAPLIQAQLAAMRQRTAKPINANFFCHPQSQYDQASDASWRQRLQPYFKELGLVEDRASVEVAGAPFNDAQCRLVEQFRPEVVSFHFGLPAPALLARVKASGAKVIASATTVAEARWLEVRGCDAIIAQGLEAGGHRGMFLTDDLSTQVGTFALLPQVADAVRVPVIAAGGISDGRGIAAAMMLGAAAVQIGTAYLFTPEAKISAPYRAALQARGEHTVVTNVHTGRPGRSVVNRITREVGAIAAPVPDFPLARDGMLPLTVTAEGYGSDAFSPLWSGQAAPLGRSMPAAKLTRLLASDALCRLSR